MYAVEKVEVLGQAAQYDVCTGCGTETSRVRGGMERWIYPAVLPDGQRVQLLKVLLSNACTNNCLYCANRCGRDSRRVSFQPEELARLFDQMHRANLVKGLFLSSGILRDPTYTMARMLAAVELVRFQYEFRGYIHLKILPGAEDACIERATELASRVSVNLEAPNQERLARIAGEKRLESLVASLRKAKQYALAKGTVPAGLTTQFVVGAADESDREILSTASNLLGELALARVYFSAFQPVEDTPLEGRPPTPLMREHRLYQSDFLLRQYSFQFRDLVFDGQGNLPLAVDPKLAWALHHPERFPVEVNRASRAELLRIPGIGPRSVSRILRLRREGKFQELRDLKAVGAVAQHAAPFVLLDGRRPPRQLSLWEGEVPAPGMPMEAPFAR